MPTNRKIRAGTRIEVKGFDLQSNVTWEAARIGRWHHSYRNQEKPAGYYPVTFAADGARLLAHESGFRVVENRL